MNRQIRAREVLLIDAEGEKRGVVAIQDALRIAEDAGLDLVEVASTTVPPVCKVMDYGKMEYQQRKRSTTSKSQLDMKEINFSMKIGPHDIETKLKKAKEFLGKGHKLRINLILRGRERSYADTKGLEQLKRLIELLGDLVVVEQQSKGMIGNRLFAILTPNKKPVVVGGKAVDGDSKSSGSKPVVPGGNQIAEALKVAPKSKTAPAEPTAPNESAGSTPG